jgi:hypothetical protein
MYKLPYMVSCIPLLDGLPHLVDAMLTFSQVGSGCPGIPPDSEEGKEAAN